MIRTAVIGLGSMGKNHARIYNDLEDVELVALVDVEFSLAEDLSRIYHVPAFDNIPEMIDRTHPEAISVAVPVLAHYSVAKQVLEAGIHVLLEKPIAPNLDDARILAKTAKQNNRILAVGHIERYNPAIIELKKRLIGGELGKLYQIHTRRLGPFPPRINDVGVIIDLGTHDLDIMRYLTGKSANQIFAVARSEINNPHEDMATGIIRFEDDIVGLLEVSWLTPTKIREVYVTGEKGMFFVNYITQDLLFYENADANQEPWDALSLLRGVSEGTVTRYDITKKEPLRSELEAYINQIKGSSSSIIDSQDAIGTLSLALEMIESAKTGMVWRGEFD